jgi:predicted flap endonuclease-1-like 5' DNA nuclease
MALFPAFDTELDPKDAFRFPIGAASPLWLAFGAAAGAGVAYWWMTRWTQPANLEAFTWFSPKAAEPAGAEPTPLIVAQPTLETPIEATVEPIEAAAEVVVETVAELAVPVVDAAEQAPQEAVAVVDDLTRLIGVGPRLAARLAELGVTRFTEIAAWTDEDLAKFDKALDLKGRAARDAWVAQARRFAEA